MKFDGYKVVFGVVGMIKIIRNFKNGLLNKSDQYRHYKSEYLLLTENLSSSQKKIEDLEINLIKEEDNNRKLLNKIEELKLENHVIKGNSQNKNKILGK
jgi:hypothetical protein